MPNRAFTLIEVLITLGILAALGTVLVSVSPDVYREYTSRSARDVLVTNLMHARAQAMNGVVGGGQLDMQNIDLGSKRVAYSGPATISFNRLSGDSVPATVILSDGVSTLIITIGSEGQISWTH